MVGSTRTHLGLAVYILIVCITQVASAADSSLPLVIDGVPAATIVIGSAQPVSALLAARSCRLLMKRMPILCPPI